MPKSSAVRRVLFVADDCRSALALRPLRRRLQACPDLEVRSAAGPEHGPPAMSTRRPDGGGSLEVPRPLLEDAVFDATVAHPDADLGFLRRPGSVIRIPTGIDAAEILRTGPFDWLCLPGRAAAESWARVRGDALPGRVAVTGAPESDRLVRRGDRDAALVRMGLDPELPTILVAADRMVQDTSALADAAPWNVLVLHDVLPRPPIPWGEPVGGGRLREVRDWDPVPWMRIADLLVTDRSEHALRWSLLDRPTVFLGEGCRRAWPAVARRVEQALSEPARGAVLRRRLSRRVFHIPGDAVARTAGLVRCVIGLGLMPAEVEVLETPGPARTAVASA